MFKGIQVRRHNRKIFKDNILKGNNRKLNQAPHLVFGFALNDRVKFNGIECFVHGRRSKGYFDLKDIDGNTIQWNTMLSLPMKCTNLVSSDFQYFSQSGVRSLVAEI